MTVSYADPAPGRVTATPHRGWIAHDLSGSGTRLLIPRWLHGRLHHVPDPYFSSGHYSTSYAVRAEELGSVLLAAVSPTCRTWTSAKHVFERRLRFTWDSPVQNLILTARALGARTVSDHAGRYGRNIGPHPTASRLGRLYLSPEMPDARMAISGSPVSHDCGWSRTARTHCRSTRDRAGRANLHDMRAGCAQL